VAPPPTKKKAGEQRAQCRNIEECQAKAEERERLQAAEGQDGASNEAAASPIQTTAGGVRYRDLVVPKDGDGGAVVKVGDQVDLQYKVLKLGKRSYDGLSGEGTVVFSRGYGLEDDESKPGEKSFSTVVGSYSNIAALNEALVGMRVGGARRFTVVPQLGWRRPSRECDGGPGGSGTGGDVKTDFVVVPTAQLVAEEACFDQTRRPFPASYAEQRRMAQRFDQSLIMEVQVLGARQSTDDLL
jgi:FKBP-type peptidyl-prolyl cis-trans isomerase